MNELLGRLFVFLTLWRWVVSQETEQNGGKRRGQFTSFHCIGGSQVFKTESMKQASIKVFPLNDPEFRTCHYQNICLVNGELTYFQRYNDKHKVPQDYLPTGFDGKIHHLSYLRGFTMPIKTVVGNIPSEYPFHNVDIVYLDSNSWSFNYGHYILDNIIPTFITYKLFQSSLTSYNATTQEYTTPDYRDSQQLFETDCRLFSTLEASFADRPVTYNRSMGSYHQACLHRLQSMSPYFFSHSPVFVNELKDQPRCFRHLISGQGSSYGLKSIDLSRAYFFTTFRDYVLTRNAMLVPKKVENLILVGLRTVGSAGGSIINDLCERIQTAYARIEQLGLHTERYTVECFVPSNVPFEQEIYQVQRAKVLISVHGTISYMSLFARDGTQQISLANPKELKENQMLLYATHINLLYITWDRLDELQGVLEHAITLSEVFYHLQ